MMLARVSHIMRAGPRNAVAQAHLSVKEGLLAMTRAKSGSLSIINGRGRLVGVFTDGDFRRRMAADNDLLSRSLSYVMTRRPVRIREDALAVEALKTFDEHNIDDLIVVNANNEPVGLIDSQDLPKLKLM
jgi:arabinose-5-phosphate isomerase